ncbi:peroxidase/cytochrome P450 family protein [Aspergillus mulundensis]|uniref:Fatty acid oxygenase n=1 Tax=Aspergillus mulundensis TaxID=1810919 RepID=A0A3D8SVL5_9EURO|nr:Uncharacterized protein DSM5745_02089 [Aspergillus mulundensis]RDW90314.1 Uncharacterized protein DSM5745_02089 [Aspergillus mulundensis]
MPFMQNGADTEDLSSFSPASKPKQSTLTSLLSSVQADLLSQAHRIPADFRTLRELSQTGLNGGLIDDKKYLTESIIQVLSSLPNSSALRTKITDTFIKTLWDNLHHPPLSYIGDEFRYRRADGSFNNIMYPHLGASGSHYARTVSPKHPRPAVLPDPGLIFDTLLARQEHAKEHPAKISSMLFHFATIIIHDLFCTDENDRTRVKNSSYLDLGPLYGHSQDEQTQVRTFTDGLLKPDTFSEKRLLSQPPGVCALMIAFNRFHNYVVTELARINEAGRFNLPNSGEEKSPDYVWALQKRDEDLFQTGRLITCALYVSIILNDYLRTILNLNDNAANPRSDWRLDPRKALNVFDGEGLPRGVGNQISAEFNMIYRWHATTSVADEEWLNELSSQIFGSKIDVSRLSVGRYLGGLHEYFEKAAPGEPSSWTFGGLKRGKDGMFADKDLVEVLQDGCESVAGAFGARNTPKCMKAIEMMGIQKGREWGLATLNELRMFFKLKPHSTFAEVNSDPKVAEALEALYGHPDNIELYVGIQAEEAKKPFSPGAGLCPGFTISFAILSDAVALVRGDRFYTVDYSPVNLTNFGFNIAESDFDVANGGVMYKLLMRAFPGWYTASSVYALYPFTTPAKNKEIFEKLEKFGATGLSGLEYKRPEFTKPPVAITSWRGVVELLNESKGLHVPWGKNIYHLTQHDYMLSGDSVANAEQRTFMAERLYRVPDALEQFRRFYEAITADLVRKYSKRLGDSMYQVDIVRDVCNLAHAYFCAEFFAIPLKSTNGQNGNGTNQSSTADAYTPRELSEALFALYRYVFLDMDAARSIKNRAVAAKESQRLGEIMRRVVSSTSESGWSASEYLFSRPSRLFGGKGSSPLILSGYGPQLVKRLKEGGKSVEDVVWMIVPTAAATGATQAMGWAQMLDLYLSDRYSMHWPAIQRLARSEEPEAFEKLKKYALEGFRLSTPANGVLRTYNNRHSKPTLLKDGATTKSISKGDTVFADFASAGRDPETFPDPEEIKLDRPLQLYIHHGWGAHACLGRAIVTTAGAALLKVMGKLDGLRSADGMQGEMVSKEHDGFRMFLEEDGSDWGVFPRTKKVVFTGLGGLAEKKE